MWPRAGGFAGKGKAVAWTWHLDVGEKQHDLLMMFDQQCHGCVGVYGFKSPKTGILEDVHGIDADQSIVVHDKGIRGGVLRRFIHPVKKCIAAQRFII